MPILLSSRECRAISGYFWMCLRPTEAFGRKLDPSRRVCGCVWPQICILLDECVCGAFGRKLDPSRRVCGCVWPQFASF